MDDARDWHVSFDENEHPNKVLLRELGRAQERFYRDIAALQENALAKDKVFEGTELAEAIEGVPLVMPAYLVINPPGILALSNGGLMPADIIQNEHTAVKYDHRIRVVGTKLYLNASAAFQELMGAEASSQIQAWSAWVDVAALRLSYVPNPAHPTTLGEDLTAPDGARAYLIGALVDFMLGRKTIEGSEVAKLAKRASDDMDRVVKSFLDIAGQGASWSVARVG
jgi:hypothetical protein